MYRVGQRVRIANGPHASDCGTVRKVTSRRLLIETDSNPGTSLASVNPNHVEVLRTVRPQDFDRGFGIGGLSRHDEPVAVPSVAAIQRMEKIERDMETCSWCGASDLIDGAMFTTMAGSGYCDDCC